MAKETSRRDLGESTTSGTEMETSEQGLAANKAMARTPALPSQPVATLVSRSQPVFCRRRSRFTLTGIVWLARPSLMEFLISTMAAWLCILV